MLLIAGCRLSPSDTKNENPDLIDPAHQRLIQIDIDPRNCGWVFPVEQSLIGDLQVVLRQFITQVKRITGKEFSDRRLQNIGRGRSQTEGGSVPSA